MLLIAFGWILGIISKILFDFYRETKKKSAIAKVLKSEVEEYKKDMMKELKYMDGKRDLPSMSSPLFKIQYDSDFFESYKGNICIFKPETILQLTKFHSIMRIIESDKIYLRQLVKENEKKNFKDLIENFYEDQMVLRQKLISYSDKVLNRLKKESKFSS